MARKKEKPFKRKEVKEVKKKPLESLCNEDQLQLLRNAIAQGAIFILTGSAKAPYHEFHKGLYLEMKVPTSNGATLFDTNVVFKNNWERPIFMLTLNDVGNENILHSIREIKAGRIYSRYIYHPE